MNAMCHRLLPGLIALAGLVSPASTAAARRLENGVYAVLEEAPAKAGLRPEGAGRAVLRYDKKYSDADRKEPPEYVAIDTSYFVPLVLAGPPESSTDDRGWTLLSVTLARQHVKTLETFTRKHLNGRVAIVLDGEIVTMHKVRTVIEDGKAVITRCQDNACQAIRTRLGR